jgi:hypothetical protein
VQATAAVEEPAPSDEELAQALRLLTPANGHAEVSTVPSLGSLVAAGPHWVAEPVALSREEAAISLEAEMFRTFALMPAVMPEAAPGGEIEPVRITGVSAIAAAVENRLAAVKLAAGATALPEQGAERFSAGRLSDEHGSAEHGSETTSAETSAVAASAAAIGAVSNVASPVVDGIAAGIEAERIAPGKIEAEPEDSPATVPEGAPAEEAAAATFADVVGQNQVAQDEVEATAEPNGDGMAPAVVEGENQESSSNVEGRESMRKDVKSRSGKSNWHQIRTAPPSAATNRDVVETEKAAKAMAAAAAEGSSSSSAPDASTIASIVDSVMADLRPKIVEEIAKRLAGK